MEEIASFEERLTSLKEKGDDLVSSCTTDQMKAKTSQQVKAYHQGTRDSYSAICSSAQCVSAIVTRFAALLCSTLLLFPSPSNLPHLLTCLGVSSSGLPESGQRTAEACQSPGHSAAVPDLALHRQWGATAALSTSLWHAGGPQTGVWLTGYPLALL